MTEYVDAAALLEDCRRKQKRADEVARRARAKLGVQTATRREVLTPERRAAAFKAKRGPLGWIWADVPSPEDVLADCRTLRKIAHVFRVTPRLRRSSWRCIIHLRNGRTVKFDPATGDVLRP
jgi:hypothetical protein